MLEGVWGKINMGPSVRVMIRSLCSDMFCLTEPIPECLETGMRCRGGVLAQIRGAQGRDYVGGRRCGIEAPAGGH